MMKILFQECWLCSLSWDEPLTENIARRWSILAGELSMLAQCPIPRYLARPSQAIELHGFADASSQAVGAVVYSRVTTGMETIVTLIAVKTRVAPIKAISIPRLELTAAHLLAKLLTLVKSSLSIPITGTFCWTDSEVVLHWLSAPPRRWNTFVCNRTAEILTEYPRSCWNHVRSEDNPADCASRGLLPSTLRDHTLWWTGPTWLAESPSLWPTGKKGQNRKLPVEALCEEKPDKQLNFSLEATHQDILDGLSHKLSSWIQLLRVVSYVFRFISKVRSKVNARLTKNSDLQRSSQQAVSHSGFLTTKDLQYARKKLLKHMQITSFPLDYDAVKHGQCLPRKSKLLRLTPFLDESGLLRIGGRIDRSVLPFNAKHPIIVSKESPLALLIIRYFHKANLHTGVDATFHHVRQQFGILGARNLTRKVVFRCKSCFMNRRLTQHQILADLPIPRIQQNPCFSHTGLDYAGPIAIKETKGRSPRIGKAWFAIFVCLATKAMYLEVVSDLTTKAFIAAFKRFCARRKTPTDLYSDNGTTFHGARRELEEMRKLVQDQAKDEELADFFSTEGLNWHFIPPSAPHFGGLWESGVRSVKLHLRRVVGAAALTFEELSTVLAQIEAILNSRPLAQVSDHTVDPLTPAHFLIGQPYTAVPEPSLLDTQMNRLDRWNQLQAMVQGFWKRWHTEYLTSLQSRGKWQEGTTNLEVGTLVVLKEPNLPPAKWILGRIQEVHPGQDSKVRVVTVKTAHTTYKRPITKIAVLPLT
ncbi:uncharacterized protein [Drosophila takahashii]|uniref:uncharacterized protein n=1 Tax=Drosophila takahashii TaxID=29030 RepID=UPI001CF83CDD|nr:uncharacterized protein LOC123002398 [Drosophila takahashii]